MADQPVNLGGLLNDDIYVFRAFAEKKFRERKKSKNEVRYFAFVLRDEDVADGLSVGLTPKAAVERLETNEGYCKILAGVIHGLPYGLQVRIDPVNSDHAFICNLPLMTISDQAREQARLIGGELARRAEVVTCDPYIP
jgi:hypothetical protein